VPNAKAGTSNSKGTGQAQSGDGSASKAGSAGGGSSQFGWYHELIHDRFYSQWEQPKSIFGNAKTFVTTLQIRIEKNGRISDFKILKSSGNVVMDESVLAAARNVLQIDPLPPGLGSGGAYTVNINFELE
jgi:TonB family protein